MSIRVLSLNFALILGLAAVAGAQTSANVFPNYDASLGGTTPNFRSFRWPSSADDDRWSNVSPSEADGPTVTWRPSGSPLVSADQLRHPLTGKALRIIRKVESLISHRDYAHAREELRKAVKDPAAAPYAHSLLGQEYERNMQFEEAVPELEQAVHLLPSSVPDHANLGYALMMTGQAPAAEKELRQALSLEPANPRTHLVLGILCYWLGSRDREAEQHLRFAARELPGAHLVLARFFRLKGDSDAAEREFQTFAQSESGLDPSVARQWFQEGPRENAAH